MTPVVSGSAWRIDPFDPLKIKHARATPRAILEPRKELGADPVVAYDPSRDVLGGGGPPREWEPRLRQEGTRGSAEAEADDGVGKIPCSVGHQDCRSVSIAPLAKPGSQEHRLGADRGGMRKGLE